MVRETRLAKIKMAKKVVEQRAREKAAEERKGAEEAKKAKPADKDRYNFTDPESRIMKGADGFVQGYDAQVAVEAQRGLIVGQLVTEAANGKEQLKPIVEAIQRQSGHLLGLRRAVRQLSLHWPRPLRSLLWLGAFRAGIRATSAWPP
jgi:hypothetical protein